MDEHLHFVGPIVDLDAKLWVEAELIHSNAHQSTKIEATDTILCHHKRVNFDALLILLVPTACNDHIDFLFNNRIITFG